ncbi:sec-independent translocase [Rugosimonospora acidiphila]|uniref:Sec-independent translocase n=1 Tax=Rugosimonospora acidiphila TaxID=556531 RepID=A0ABP9RJA9_9ACTN
MFGLDNLDSEKILLLLLLALFIFGPDKLPKAIADGVKMVRNLRDMARNATGDLSRELGTDIQLEDLNPKSLLRKHLLSEEDEKALRKPLEDLYEGVQKDLKGVQDDLKGVHNELKSTAESVDRQLKPTSAGGPAITSQVAYDMDAT